MTHSPRIRPKIVIAAFVAVVLLAWMLFHPEYRADPAVINASVKAEIAKAGFRSVSGVKTATFESILTVDGAAETVDLRQEIIRFDDLLTEKRSRRYAKFYFEQSVGFYVGPIAVLRYTRSVLPVVASLLPGQFWASSRISAFDLQHVDPSFPHRAGSMLRAKITYEDQYADGEVAQTERVQLSCVVLKVVSATSVDTRLPGFASFINCEEQPEPNGRLIAAKGRDSYIVEGVKYSHLYVIDLGWSIPVEGERTVRVQELIVKETWKSELKSFTASFSADASSK
jgi:hypothetical protein